MLAKDIAETLIVCSQIMGLSIREDIGMIFGKYHMQKAQLAVELLQLQKEKGWLVPPPLHITIVE